MEMCALYCFVADMMSSPEMPLLCPKTAEEAATGSAHDSQVRRQSYTSKQDSNCRSVSAYLIGVEFSVVLCEASEGSLVSFAVLFSLPDAELHLVLHPM